MHLYVAFSVVKMFYYTSKSHRKKSYIKYICKKKKLVELKLLEKKMIDNVSKVALSQGLAGFPYVSLCNHSTERW